MKLLNRAVSALLSAAMLLTPVAAAAEGDLGFSAGDLTNTAIAESYAGGNQLNVSAAFMLDAADSISSERLRAVASLLEKSTLEMSFYDDFGTARVRAKLTTDGAELVSADALIYENGSIQLMTSLTGKYVLTLPEGTYVDGKLNLPGSDELDLLDIESPEFAEAPAFDRLRVTSNYMVSSLLNLLLGWVSSTQRDTEELYLFDDTPLEATETRDAVEQRMLGKIRTCDFTAFLWNVVSSVRDDQGEFLQAVADSLAEMGVTRYQARQVIDSLLTDETINPATDFVQLSHTIKDDGTLCQLDDVQYFMRKLEKSVDKIWTESTDNTMTMDVSYDENGSMVGFDATVPQISTLWPFEGGFTYSLKHDEYGQSTHTAHGELQVYGDRRLIGDLSAVEGEDVDGVNASTLSGWFDVENTKNGASEGIGLDGVMTYEIGTGDAGEETEHFEGSILWSKRTDGEGEDLVVATVSGMTALGEDSLVIGARAALELMDLVSLNADVSLEQAEYDDEAFAGGQAIDLTNFTQDELDAVTGEIIGRVTELSLSLMTHPSVLSDITTIIGQ
ncbi:MAG: hypothetical protein Q4G52_09880 [Clostridia bacterium]|nr:hypothetical protein [Clostridia bacterium]